MPFKSPSATPSNPCTPLLPAVLKPPAQRLSARHPTAKHPSSRAPSAGCTGGGAAAVTAVECNACHTD